MSVCTRVGRGETENKQGKKEEEELEVDKRREEEQEEREGKQWRRVRVKGKRLKRDGKWHIQNCLTSRHDSSDIVNQQPKLSHGFFFYLFFRIFIQTYFSFFFFIFCVIVLTSTQTICEGLVRRSSRFIPVANVQVTFFFFIFCKSLSNCLIFYLFIHPD